MSKFIPWEELPKNMSDAQIKEQIEARRVERDIAHQNYLYAASNTYQEYYSKYREIARQIRILNKRLNDV